VRILSAGGGPAGLFAAVLLKQRHPEYDVEVIERNPEGHAQGWGVVFWQDTLDAVSAADPETGRALRETCHQWRGLRVERGSEQVVDDDARGFAIARRDLLTLLADRGADVGVKITYRSEVDPADLPAADLVLAADGVGSRLRRAHEAHFGPRIDPGHNRYAWLGASTALDSFVFAFVKTAAGWLWCHAYGHALDRSTVVVECEERTWNGLGLGFMTSTETLALLEELFAPHLRDVSLLPPPGTGDRIPWLTFGTLSNARWHHGNVVLLGDAAHTTHFSIGSGTKLALLDSIALVDALDAHEDIPAALLAYEGARRPEVERTQHDAFHSMRWFESLPRYETARMPDFVDLLQRRRSSLQARLPAHLYLLLRRTADAGSTAVDALRRLRRR